MGNFGAAVIFPFVLVDVCIFKAITRLMRKCNVFVGKCMEKTETLSVLGTLVVFFIYICAILDIPNKIVIEFIQGNLLILTLLF